MKYCSNCGNKIDQNSKYCTNCGSKIVINTYQSNIPNGTFKKVNNNYETTNNVVNKKRSLTKSRVIILIIFFIVLSILNTIYPTNNILLAGFYGGISVILSVIIYMVFTKIFSK